MSLKARSKSGDFETQAQKDNPPVEQKLENTTLILQRDAKYQLRDLIDIEQFQYLQDRLNGIYSFPSAIVDNDGNILTATAWQDICTKFHRVDKICK